MALNIIRLGPEYIPDPTKGKPIANAKIYIGEPDKAPQLFPKTVSLQQESGAVVQIVQPVLTGAGGIPLYNGSPVSMYVDGDYSMQILDSSDNQVYYIPSMAADSSGSLPSVKRELIVSTAGQTVFTLSNAYTPGTDSLMITDNGSLIPQTDYTETDSLTVTFASGVAVGHDVEFVSGGISTSSIEATAVGYTPAGSTTETNVSDALDATTTNVNDMFALINSTNRDAGAMVQMAGFFYATPQTTLPGGGLFVWEATLNKNLANGGTIVDPDNVGGFDGTTSTLPAYLAAQGGGVGSGCWVRLGSHTNVRASWWGAKTGAASGVDNGLVVNTLIDVLDTAAETLTGGIINLDRGTYDVLTPIVFTTTHVSGLVSLKLVGEGMQNTSLVAKVGFTASSPVVSVEKGTFSEISDLHINSNNLADNALFLKGVASGVLTYSHVKLDHLRLQNSVLDGFVSESTFLLQMNEVFVTGSNLQGFNFKGFHTSVNCQQCYADNNTLNGFRIEDMMYSVFDTCASDNSGRNGYSASNLSGVNFINCGAESSQRSAFHFEASAALDGVAGRLITGIQDVKLLGCVGVNNDLSAGGWGSALRTDQIDTSNLQITVENFSEFNSINGVSVTSAGVTADHRVLGENNTFKGSFNTDVSELDISSSARIHAHSVVALTSILEFASVFGTVDQYSGILHVTASNAEPNDAAPANVAGYVLLVTKSAIGGGVSVIASNGADAGAAANHPSFAFSFNQGTNELEVTPVGSTSGTFYFYITQTGSLLGAPL